MVQLDGIGMVVPVAAPVPSAVVVPAPPPAAACAAVVNAGDATAAGTMVANAPNRSASRRDIRDMCGLLLGSRTGCAVDDFQPPLRFDIGTPVVRNIELYSILVAR
jgi:hypothetical protein